METVTNAANNVASAASKAIWGEPTKDDATKKDEPVSETAPHVLKSSVPVKDPQADNLQATKIEPLVPSGTITPTPTETMETTHIEPLEEVNPESKVKKVEDRLPVDSGVTKKVEDKLHIGDKGESSKTADGTPPTAEKDAAPVASTADHKPSLKEKIKAKLHKN